MDNEKKSKKQLIEELNELHQRIEVLKVFEEEINQTRTNQEKFTKAFLQSSIPIGITTLEEGRFVDVSDAFLNMMGRSRDEVIGHTSREIGFITEKQRAFFFYNLQEKGRVENLEMKVGAKDGTFKHGLFNAVMINIDNKMYLLTVMTDTTDRKQMEKTLKSKEEIFFLITENMSDMIRVTNAQGINIYASPSHVKVLGYMPEGRLCKSLFDIGHPDDVKMIIKTLEEGRANNKTLGRVEYRVRHADGSYIWLETVANSIKDEQGNVKGGVFCSRDITERKQLEATITSSESNYQRLHQSMMDAFVSVDLEGHIKDFNYSYLDMLGYTADEINTLSYKDITPEKWHMIEEKIVESQVLKRGYSDIYEKEYRKKDGTVFPIELRTTLLRDKDGTPISMWAIVRDISERKLTEALIAESEEKYREIVENIGDCIILTDINGIIKHVTNPLTILGYCNEEMIGLSWFSMNHEDDLVRTIKTFSDGNVKAWHEISFATRLQNKNGDYTSVEVTARALTNLERNVKKYILTIQDGSQILKQKKDRPDDLKLIFTERPLSLREKEILNWIIEGKSTWDISSILKITERTVKFHVDNIMKKLCAVNRPHAVAIAMRNEMIDSN